MVFLACFETESKLVLVPLKLKASSNGFVGCYNYEFWYNPETLLFLLRTSTQVLYVSS